MNRISHKHHFVPRFFLRNFSSCNGKNKFYINVFNKKNFKEYNASIEKVAYIENFHTFEIDGNKSDIIEKAHNNFFEKTSAIKLNRILSKLNNFINTCLAYNCVNDAYLKDHLFNEHFDIVDKKFISFLLAYFILRGRKIDEMGSCLFQQSEPIIREMCNVQGIFDETRINDNLIKLLGTTIQRRLSQQKDIFYGEKLNEIANLLYMHVWSIGLNFTDELLYSSDNVHAMDTLNQVESIYNNIGYSTYGNVIMFPISPRICICMYDFNFLHGNNFWFEDLKFNFLTKENVRYINSLMLYDSIDELYSYDGNFMCIQEFCEKLEIGKGHRPYGIY